MGMYYLWLKLTCNWFMLGLVCQIKGHSWRKELITVSPDYDYVVIRPGYTERRRNGRNRAYRVTVCSRCGHYRGSYWDLTPKKS